MTLTDALALFAIMALLAALPSTSVMLVVARSATAGVASGIAVTVGIVLGDLVFVLLALRGMAAVAEALGAMFFLVRCLAGAYLIWFGWQLLRARPQLRFGGDSTSARGAFANLLAGLLVTLGDVKAIAFYASLFPLFVDPLALTSTGMALIVAITLVTVAVVKLVYVLAARRLARVFHPGRLSTVARLAAGGTMVGAGSYLIVRP